MAIRSLRAGMVAARRAGAGGGAPRRGRGRGAARAGAAAADAPSEEESKTDRMERRARETSEVELRVKSVADADELMRELEGDQLVVLEVESDTLCELRDVERVNPAYFDQPEEVLMEPCGDFKHSFQRIARNCPDVKFVSFVGDASKETLSFAKESLGVGTFPTLQFYKGGRLLWQHEGVDDALRDLDEGMLFYRDRDSQQNYYVNEICSRADLDRAIADAHAAQTVLVLDVSSASASPCLHIFPAVVSLARAFQGNVSFARIIQDRNAETAALVADELKVDEVPTFIFYFRNEERHRFTSSSRGDLIGQLLEQQEKIGYKLPPPKKRAPARRR